MLFLFGKRRVLLSVWHVLRRFIVTGTIIVDTMDTAMGSVMNTATHTVSTVGAPDLVVMNVRRGSGDVCHSAPSVVTLQIVVTFVTTTTAAAAAATVLESGVG